MLEFNFLLNPFEWGLIGLFLISCVILIRFYLHYYHKISSYISPLPTTDKKPISVVLSGKNKHEHIKQNLPFWLEQKYSNFEVIVVYDNTDEELLSLLRLFSQRYPRLKLINTNQSINFFDEQKFSLSIGIKSAENDYIILTTAECRPTNEYCIDYIQAAFKPETKIVVSYCTYLKGKGISPSFTHYHLYEKMLQYLSLAIQNKAYAGSRQIMAYRKNFFLEHLGYTSVYAIDTGSYDFFYPHITSPKEVSVQIDWNATVKCNTKYNFKQWLNSEIQFLNTINIQKSPARKAIRWYRAALPFFYLFFTIGMLYFFFGKQGPIPCFFSLWFWIFALLALLKYLIQAIVMQKIATKFQKVYLWIYIPFYEILYLPLHLTFCFHKNKK